MHSFTGVCAGGGFGVPYPYAYCAVGAPYYDGGTTPRQCTIGQPNICPIGFSCAANSPGTTLSGVCCSGTVTTNIQTSASLLCPANYIPYRLRTRLGLIPVLI
jgi:hypothetical protein